MALAAIPTIAAIASPERVISAPKAVKEIPPTELKPKAHTRMSAAIIVFLDLVKSTWFSTTFLIPIAGALTAAARLKKEAPEPGCRPFPDDGFSFP